jgi:hypothetical protein
MGRPVTGDEYSGMSEANRSFTRERSAMFEAMSGGAAGQSAVRVRRGFARLYPGLNFQTWYPVVRPLDAAGFFIRYQGRERHVWRAHFDVGQGQPGD